METIRTNPSIEINKFVINQLIRQIKNVVKNLDLFNKLSRKYSPIQHILENFVNIYRHIMLSLTQMTLFLRDSKESYDLLVSMTPGGWNKVEEQFSNLDDAFNSANTRVSDSITDAGTLLQQPFVDSRPIAIMPPRNTKFFGRERVLDEIHERLRNNSSATEPIVVTLNGLGGIGKSQIAREYAYRWKAQYDIILWISSETVCTLNKSLQRAAAELRLGNASQTDSFQNKVAVRDILEQSGKVPNFIFFFPLPLPSLFCLNGNNISIFLYI